ncbi:hypothetical protein H5410_052511 [Solanum commersonii]|uniref:Uncharacterized protein n=1 Tax=Solanum commersonii TaxID=4109 RepID=A0A9J5X3L1_SOLCO|nr:hypothetical protein H5410_052511 [Solanum commersonii]
MTLAFQLVAFTLIATSLILLISCTAVFASPDGLSFPWVSLILSSLEPIRRSIQNQMTPLIFLDRDTLNLNLSPQRKCKSNKENKKLEGIKLLE